MTSTQRILMKTKSALIHKGLALYIALSTFSQMFLSSVWHSGIVNSLDAHVFFGLSLLLASLLALIAAAVGKLPRVTVGCTALLFALILLQPFLMGARRYGLPIVSFHALNAAFIGALSSMVVGMVSGEQAVGETAVSPVHGD